MNKLNIKVEDVLGSRARVKILKSLAINEELTISQIISTTRLNNACVNRHLDYLERLNFVQMKKYGRIRIFRFKTEDPNVRCFKDLVSLWEEI